MNSERAFVSLWVGVMALMFFLAGAALMKELARTHPNSLMIERTPKADRQ